MHGAVAVLQVNDHGALELGRGGHRDLEEDPTVGPAGNVAAAAQSRGPVVVGGTVVAELTVVLVTSAASLTVRP
jgi:hypothetical protein